MNGILRFLVLTAGLSGVCSATAAGAEAVDLEQLVAQSAGDYVPVTVEQVEGRRSAMIAAAQALQQALRADPQLERSWKEYLQWSLLEPHLSADPPTSSRDRARLARVLDRFRANHPGLELPVFLHTASAIEAYLDLAASPKTSEDYQRLLQWFSQPLSRHAESPSIETTWELAQRIGVVAASGQSESLIRELRSRLAQPNLTMVGSSRLVGRLGGQPVDNSQPVRDLILGTRIYGNSHTTGVLDFRLRNDPNSIALQVMMTGRTQAGTRGYNGPVIIRSNSSTDISASSTVRISDAAFLADAATGCAQTDAQIRSICKTGGKLGRRLVEKIAWKRARQQERLSERIASQHAADRVRENFTSQLDEALNEARSRYLQQVRAPLVRRAAWPNDLAMSSTSQSMRIATTFATRRQLGAATPPPELENDADLTMQIHDSAVGNFLALAIGGVTISQDSASQPAKISGNVPPWLERLASAEDAASEGPATAHPSGDEVEFKPWSITLHRRVPVSTEFDDGQLTIRIRASVLISDGNELEDWDFIVRYAVSHDGNQISLTREGSIEVYPYRFDPEWPGRIPGPQAGVRNTLQKNVNERADAGVGFPSEFVVQPIRLPQLGELDLLQLEADDHWLTLSWRIK